MCWIIKAGAVSGLIDCLDITTSNFFFLKQNPAYNQTVKNIKMWIVLQANGKYKQKGKEYVVEDGDIIFFKFNAGAGLTGKKEKK